jgi:hypothetical protein
MGKNDIEEIMLIGWLLLACGVVIIIGGFYV